MLIAGCLRRWRWAFWFLVVIGPLNLYEFILGTSDLASRTPLLPPAVTGAGLGLATIGLALWVWPIVAVVRFGPLGHAAVGLTTRPAALPPDPLDLALRDQKGFGRSSAISRQARSIPG